jgi:hypothetical protein
VADQKKDDRDSMAREVDRLLKQLPGADPMLRGEPEPSAPAPGPAPGVRPAARPPAAAPAGPTRREWWGVWGRVLLALCLGVALTQWPYSHACDWDLAGYLGAVFMLLLAAAWGVIASWRRRMGVAHAVALLVLLGGLGLAAQQILPRVGYAAASASWRCTSPAPAAAR